ncbi:MAG: efflux RND transporter periplasmic adaptor subunit [Bdellovibrionales bacterium]|nr:efflux RND transporter periplasmic adaptor subunit [Bdellovibrionales bacterium]
MNKYYFIFAVSLLSLAACSQPDSENRIERSHTNQIESYYTCSMHPQVKEDKPGKCPICHMNLTKIEVDPETEMTHADHNKSKEVEKDIWYCKQFPEITSNEKATCPVDGTDMILKPKLNKAAQIVATIKLQKSQLDHFKPAFFPVTTMMMDKKVRLLGTVLQSEKKESSIPARIDGRVEKVYVQSTGSFIKVGDPVVDLYSPVLITAGEEYLIARKSFERNKSNEFQKLFKQSEERLKQWGIKNFQYELWYAQGKVPSSITIYSNASGIVQKYHTSVGRYFKEGQNLFELSDLSEVWVEMDVYEHDSALVSLGQKVQLEFTALPGEVLEGVVDFVNPVLDPDSRTLKVRTTIKNDKGLLKPGMVADATLNIELRGHPLVVPRSAVIDTGKRKVVWVQTGPNKFQAKEIHAGYESQGYIEILHGLSEKENVVMDGNFLLDAQAQLFGGYEDMKGTGSGGHNH